MSGSPTGSRGGRRGAGPHPSSCSTAPAGTPRPALAHRGRPPRPPAAPGSSPGQALHPGAAARDLGDAMVEPGSETVGGVKARGATCRSQPSRSRTGRCDGALPLRTAVPLRRRGRMARGQPRDPRPPRTPDGRRWSDGGRRDRRQGAQEAAGPRTPSPGRLRLGDAMASPAGPDVPLQLAGRPMPARTQLPQPPGLGRAIALPSGRRGAARAPTERGAGCTGRPSGGRSRSGRHSRK